MPRAAQSDRVLIVKHVPWEGPHRIAGALIDAGLSLDERCVLDGDELPAPDEVAGAVFMGGPMNVDEVDRYPGLLAEREWIAEAHGLEVPMLGVCLGSQLIASALGSEVTPGGAPEIGWDYVTVAGSDDPLARHLAPYAEVLHWHGDVFSLPPGAELLASSAQTEVQAFRCGSAWGFLFHAEADRDLVESWLAESSMLSEAADALGAGRVEIIRARAESIDAEIRERTDPLFAEFARIVLAGRS